MEIFYSDEILDGLLRLSPEETAHCMRVLRHKAGDGIDVIDGRGTLYHCVLLEDEGGAVRRGKGEGHTALARIVGAEALWGAHPYRLTLAVCPTKNPDRFEWMAEKVTEVGIDTLAPVIGERSERRVLKTDRLQRILLSAAKQSLKGAIPELLEPQTVMEFLEGMGEASACGKAEGAGAAEVSGADEGAGTDELRVIAYCSDEIKPRAFIMDLLRQIPDNPRITVLIGPEGDFSPAEVQAAMAAGFIPVSLGASRLRTETAAITAAEAVYLSFPVTPLRERET